MTDKNKALDISIMGRTYKVSCADEEREALLRAVAYLDQKMNEIKSGGRVGSAERAPPPPPAPSASPSWPR
jgi:cell division protein ZapA